MSLLCRGMLFLVIVDIVIVIVVIAIVIVVVVNREVTLHSSFGTMLVIQNSL